MMKNMVQKNFFKIQVTLEDPNRWSKEYNVSQVCLISLLKIEYFAKSLAWPCVMSFTYEFMFDFKQISTISWNLLLAEENAQLTAEKLC